MGLLELYKENININDAFQQKCEDLMLELNNGSQKLGTNGKTWWSGSKQNIVYTKPEDIIGEHKKAPIKKRVRTMYKFIYKYDYKASGLTDIVRTSFIFDDVSNLWAAVQKVDTAFAAEGGIVAMKDRLTEAPASGYSDVLLNVRFQGIVCEVQLHLKEFIKLKGGKGGMHAAYKKARHFGTAFEKICYPE